MIRCLKMVQPQLDSEKGNIVSETGDRDGKRAVQKHTSIQALRCCQQSGRGDVSIMI